MATARIMETWAHGEDVADALGVTRPVTDRLRHIAYLGFRTLGHSFAAHGRAVPTAPVRVELAAPTGRDLGLRVRRTRPTGSTGPALDFCLLVTRRRHRADLALVATGPVADGWLDVAQAFAGPPGDRQPRERASAAQRSPERGRNGPDERVLRVGNASGFYGDRFTAWREMLDGGELDVLTGDYLAELTMLILGRDRMRGPRPGLREDVPAAA